MTNPPRQATTWLIGWGFSRNHRRKRKREGTEGTEGTCTIFSSLNSRRFLLLVLGGSMRFQSPRGMEDILPEDQPYWRQIIKSSEKLAQTFGYERLDPTLVEETGLFLR